jgi:hypothetical protein
VADREDAPVTVRRVVSVLAVAVCLMPILSAPAAAAPAFTVEPMTFTVTVGPQDDTSCTVDADLYKPRIASASNPVPAILATNGFGGDKRGFTAVGAAYAERGYAFLAYSGLGFGASGCKIYLDDPDWDGKAGSQLVSYLGGSLRNTAGESADFIVRDAVAHDGTRRPDDPRVGMLNGSYGGAIQFAIASQDPRVDAISPANTWNDLAYALAPNNTDLASGVSSPTPGVVKADWPPLFTAAGLLGLRSGDPGRLGPCPNFADWVCAGLGRTLATGYPDTDTTARLRRASVSSYVDRIRIPTLLTQGQHDTLFNLQESVATYRALRAQRTPVAMLWISAGHSGGNLGNAEIDHTDLEAAYQTRMELAFFEHHLKGRGPAPEGFSFFRDWEPYSGDAAPAVGTAPGYPVATTRPLHLSGTGDLVAEPSAVRPGTAVMTAQPAPMSTGGGTQDLGSQDVPGTSVAFTTAPFERDTDVVGIPELVVTVDAPTFARTQALDPTGKLVLFAKVVDVSPDGGQVVLPANLISAARVPVVTRPVRIELPGVVHRFARGHQLRLVLSTGSVAYRGNTGAGPVTVRLAPDQPGRLDLPVLGSPTGPVGSGPWGTTPFLQPSRSAAPEPGPQPRADAAPESLPAPAGRALPATGPAQPWGAGAVAVLLAAVGLTRLRRRGRTS